MLTQEKVRRLFSYNKKTGILKYKNPKTHNIKKGETVNSKCNGYLRTNIDGKFYYVHRIIWLGVYGYFPENGIDHEDQIRHHNWIKNLREVSDQCQQRNQGTPKNNTSGIKGVTWYKPTNKWKPQIMVNKKSHSLGYYEDFDDAVCARLAAEQHFGWEVCNSSSPAYQHVKSFQAIFGGE